MRFSRPIFALIGFMLAAWVILFLVTDLYLIPAIRVTRGWIRWRRSGWQR